MCFEASSSARASALQAAVPQSSAQSVAPPTNPARDLVTRYCVTCHNERVKTAGLSLDKADAEQVCNSAETWEKVVVKLRSRAMPPSGIRRPDNATYDAVAEWLETELDRAAVAHPNPGRPSDLHRLNRTEYANAVRDLLGLEIDATSMLPPDAQAHGFDTNADALSMEPALLDRYLTAAARIARLAIGDPTLRPAFERYTAVKGNSNEQTWLWQTDRLSEDFPLGSRGGIAVAPLLPGGWRVCLQGSAGEDLCRRDPRSERTERDRDSCGRHASRNVCAGRRQNLPQPNRLRTVQLRRIRFKTRMTRCRYVSR